METDLGNIPDAGPMSENLSIAAIGVFALLKLRINNGRKGPDDQAAKTTLPADVA